MPDAVVDILPLRKSLAGAGKNAQGASRAGQAHGGISQVAGMVFEHRGQQCLYSLLRESPFHITVVVDGHKRGA